jgi:hypothetical protein
MLRLARQERETVPLTMSNDGVWIQPVRFRHPRKRNLRANRERIEHVLFPYVGHFRMQLKLVSYFEILCQLLIFY